MSLIKTNRHGERRARAVNGAPPFLEQSYPAVPAAVPVARRAIAQLAVAAGASEEQLHAIRLACSEALSNVVQYAYPASRGEIHVTVRLAGGDLWVLIADDGCGLHAGRDSQGLGIGLPLIIQMTDSCAIVERSLGGTELQLQFVLRGGGNDQSRGSVASANSPASPRFSTTT